MATEAPLTKMAHVTVAEVGQFFDVLLVISTRMSPLCVFTFVVQTPGPVRLIAPEPKVSAASTAFPGVPLISTVVVALMRNLIF